MEWPRFIFFYYVMLVQFLKFNLETGEFQWQNSIQPFFMIHIHISNEEMYPSSFSNSEAFASELLENIYLWNVSLHEQWCYLKV